MNQIIKGENMKRLMKEMMQRVICLIIAISVITVVAVADQNQTKMIKIVQPIIKLKTIKGVINGTDGIIEIYVENTWTNGLNIDISATGTGNIYFSSEIFQTSQRAPLAVIL